MLRAAKGAHEADTEKGLSFVRLDEYAKHLVGNAAHARAKYGKGIVIPLFSNLGFVPFLRNLICSMRRLQVHNWLVIAMDNSTCPALMGSPGLGEQSACVYPYGATAVTSQQGVAVYRSVAFNRMVMQRPLWVRFLLQRGYSVVQCDLDIVWLHDPQPLFRDGRVVLRPGVQPTMLSAANADAFEKRFPRRQHRGIQYWHNDKIDMAFQSEQAYGLNGGFYFARPTNNTITFFDDWIAQLSAMIGTASFEEQHALNGAMVRVKRTPNRTLNFARLAEREFPNGKLWWSYPMEIDKRLAYIVHVNWNKQQKKSRMARDLLWFLDSGDARCAEDFDPFADSCQKLCAPVAYASPGGSSRILKSCAALNNEDDVRLRRTGLPAFNKTGAWPSGIANVLWHPLAYAALDKLPNATCKRRLTTPFATEMHEAAFGAASRARVPPNLDLDAAKPW